nr:protein FAR1-RELATED SEQUENCE 6-like [Triticum aestivum]
MVVLIPGEGELAFGGSQDDDDTEDASPGSKELAAMVEAATAASVELDAAADWAQPYGDDRMPCAPARARERHRPRWSRHAVRFSLAYFDHHRRASNLAAAASSSGRRRCRSSSWSMAATSTPATPTRHPPRRPSHGYLDHGYTTLRSRLPPHQHKGLPPCLSNVVGFRSSHDFRDASIVRLWEEVHRLTFELFSSLTVCAATL